MTRILPTRMHTPAVGILVACTLIITCLLLCLSPRLAFADESVGGTNIVLTDGQTYDVSTASNSTTAYIQNPGSYTLTGSSNKMRLVIQSGNVTVYLADSLKINASEYSRAGVRTAAIEVEDMGGTVMLISKPGAKVELSGYAGKPAISKEGTKTRLEFATEEAANPGTIQASASVLGGAGIGSTGASIGAYATVGNIVFYNGTIVAKGGLFGAGIGGGNHSSCDGITIVGGTITAVGGGRDALSVGGAAGIGGGNMASGSNILITGGNITATGGENGAGIGGGNMASSWGGKGSNITIEGGTVVASGRWGGAGIGGGREGAARDITISGGSVTATGGRMSACGIGGGGGNHYGTGSNIRISGGTVTATGADNTAGIGSNSTGDGETSVIITGGKVTAQAGAGGWGIGGGGKNGPTSAGGTTKITISGGTVYARGAAFDIGSNNPSKNFSLCIIGGSVDVAKLQTAPIDQAGDIVNKTIVALQGASEGTLVTALDTSPISPTYGTKDLLTQNPDKLYLWLPQFSVVYAAVTSSGLPYVGEVVEGDQGALLPATTITLDAEGGAQNGSAFGLKGRADLASFVAVEDTPDSGRHLLGYATAGHEMIISASGGLLPNTSLTDSNAKWTSESLSLTLFAQWAPNTYFLNYEANAPAAASHPPTGTMLKQDFSYGESKALTSNSFALPGWQFMGWNTAADGTGQHYADGQTVSNLSTEDGKTITLYAEWEALSYTVNFAAGTGSGTMAAQQMTYDSPARLSKNTFSGGAQVFLGWSTGAFGSLYGDEAEVANLGALDASGVPLDCTLTAEWAGSGKITVALFSDGVPLTGLQADIELRAPTWSLDGFVETDPGVSGIYELGHSGTVSPGVYQVHVEGFGTSIETLVVDEYGSGTIVLSFCTVDIDAEHFADAWIESGGVRVTRVENVLPGSELLIGSSTTTGYVFESYSALGSVPKWSPGPTSAHQTITVTGASTITAHPRAAQYTLAFDANGGTGSVAPQQHLVYDVAERLNACTYTREGYSFAGWTLSPRWTGPFYADTETVQNLSSEDGATVALYAQWTPHNYWIEFSSNAGGAGVMTSQKCFYDLPSNLTAHTLAYEHHRFTGWNTEADGSGTNYADEAEVLNLSKVPDDVVTLHAQWEHDAYTVVFDANGGVGTMSNQELWNHESEILDPCTYTKQGFTFEGWNLAADGSGASYANAAEVTDLASPDEVITLYAQWKIQSGGDDDDKDSKREGFAKTGDSPIPWLIIGALLVVAVSLLIVSVVIRRKSRLK